MAVIELESFPTSYFSSYTFRNPCSRFVDDSILLDPAPQQPIRPGKVCIDLAITLTIIIVVEEEESFATIIWTHHVEHFPLFVEKTEQIFNSVNLKILPMQLSTGGLQIRLLQRMIQKPIGINIELFSALKRY